MRWPTPCKSPKMSWRNSRRLLLKLVSHTEEGTLLLSAAHLYWIYPTPVMSSGASRMWAFCWSHECLCAKESLGSFASGLSLWPRSTKAGTRQSGCQGALADSPALLLQGGLCCFLRAEEISKQVLQCFGLGSTSGLAECLVLVVLVWQIG